ALGLCLRLAQHLLAESAVVLYRDQIEPTPDVPGQRLAHHAIADHRQRHIALVARIDAASALRIGKRPKRPGKQPAKKCPVPVQPGLRHVRLRYSRLPLTCVIPTQHGPKFDWKEADELSRAREPSLHRRSVHQTGLQKMKFAIAEYGKVGNAANTVSRSKLRNLLRIDLEHDSLASKIARDLCNMRRSRAAGATPRSPEIDQDRDFAVADDFVELLRIDLDGIRHGRQSRFAGPTLPSVGEMFARNSIRLSAGRALSDDSHSNPLFHRVFHHNPRNQRGSLEAGSSKTGAVSRFRNRCIALRANGPTTYQPGPKAQVRCRDMDEG